jgi:hypothetical protein
MSVNLARGLYTVRAPDGTAIQGTLESIHYCTAYAATVAVSAHGDIEPLWSGETAVNYNAQRTEYEGDDRIWMDCDDRRWRESELVFRQNDDDGAPWPGVPESREPVNVPSDEGVIQCVRQLLPVLRQQGVPPTLEWALQIVCRAYGVG